MKALKRTLTLLLTAVVMTAAIPYAAYATEETARSRSVFPLRKNFSRWKREGLTI